MLSLDRFLLSYMSSRCDVSSQHKLPTYSELRLVLDKYSDFLDVNKLRPTLDQMVVKGKLFKYGPYYSDHEIDVL
jgi:hypothetical protein